MMDDILTKLDPTALSDPSTYAGPIYALFIFFEITFIVIAKKGGDYETRDTVTNILLGTGSAIFGFLLTGAAVLLLFAFYNIRVMTLETTPLMLVILFFLDDFRFYWAHRFSHRIRWFWANHVVHHSSQHYNLSVALRQPWFSSITGLVVIYVPFVWLGVHPGAMLFVGSVNLLYQFFIHTEAIHKFPKWIEYIFNTPSHHRVHHSTNPEYLDMNYGGVFIVWDRIFHTFAEQDDGAKLEYGIIKNLGTFNPLRIATHEFVSIFRDMFSSGLTLKQRLSYVFAVPGWSHDGSRQTSDDIKRQAVLELAEPLESEIAVSSSAMVQNT